MQTTTMKRVVDAVIRRQKGDPTVAWQDPARLMSIAGGMDRRIIDGWTYGWWPETMRMEQRWFRATWSITTPYATGDQIYYPTTDSYYECIQANTGATVTDPLYWTELTYFDAYVAWEQAGKTVIGRARCPAYSANPRGTESVKEYRFSLSENGIQFNSAQVASSVWLEFQVRPLRFSATEYVAGTSYAAGDVVFYTPTGDSYLCLAATGAEPTDVTVWQRQEIPLSFERYLVSAAFAETLRDDGAAEAADAEDARAQAELERMYERQILATGQAGRVQVRVY